MCERSPASAWLRHGDGADAFPSSHRGYEAIDLRLAAIVTDVGHRNLRMQSEARARAVRVHPGTHTHTQGEGGECLSLCVGARV